VYIEKLSYGERDQVCWVGLGIVKDQKLHRVVQVVNRTIVQHQWCGSVNSFHVSSTLSSFAEKTCWDIQTFVNFSICDYSAFGLLLKINMLIVIITNVCDLKERNVSTLLFSAQLSITCSVWSILTVDVHETSSPLKPLIGFLQIFTGIIKIV